MKLYESKILIPVGSYSVVDESNHTMGKDLKNYLIKSVPVEFLQRLVADKMSLEIHGLYDGHIDLLKKKMNWSDVKEYTSIKTPNRALKMYYPKIYLVEEKGQKFFLLTVFPGREYVDHIAGLFRNYLEMIAPGSSKKILRVYRYPKVERSVYAWSGIAQSGIVKKGDYVILGYAEVMDHLYSTGFELVDFDGNDLYKWFVFKNLAGHRILFFGFTYNYWGSIIGRICSGLYADGVSLVIQVANLGSCRKPDDVGGGVFAPMFFCRIQGRNLIPSQVTENPILDRYPQLNSGIHGCVGSVLDETFEPFRSVISQAGITSVETEGFHIALAAGAGGRGIGFSGIYFATDYVKKSKTEKGSSKGLSDKSHTRRIRKRMLPSCVEPVIDYIAKTRATPRVTLG